MWDYDEKELFVFLKGSCKTVFDHMMEQKHKDSKLIHEIPKNSPMRYATMGELYAILDSGKVKKILKKEIENMDDFKNHFQIVLEYRNFQDHAKELNMDTGELQHHEKMLLVGSCIACTKALNNFPKIIINRDSTD